MDLLSIDNNDKYSFLLKILIGPIHINYLEWSQSRASSMTLYNLSASFSSSVNLNHDELLAPSGEFLSKCCP